MAIRKVDEILHYSEVLFSLMSLTAPNHQSFPLLVLFTGLLTERWMGLANFGVRTLSWMAGPNINLLQLCSPGALKSSLIPLYFKYLRDCFVPVDPYTNT